MRISKKRKLALYSAISNPIMDLRVLLVQQFKNHNQLGKYYESLDRKLFNLEVDINQLVDTALGIDNE